MTAAVFEERSDAGQAASALMSAAVHLLLLAVLVFGVQWQNRPPEAIAVELWEPPPAPAPVVEAPKPPPPPEPTPVVVKPEPVVPKPEIAEKAPPPKPKPVAKVEPKPVPKPAPKAEPKPKPEPPKAAAKPRDEEAQRQIREQLLREQAALAGDRERQQIKDQLTREAAATSGKAKADWVDKIRIHIRSRIRVDVAQAVAGNPEAIFTVTLLPSYEVLRITKQKSSGNAAYDDEVERAILKSSPLPRPDKAELFERELRLTFRPRD